MDRKSLQKKILDINMLLEENMLFLFVLKSNACSYILDFTNDCKVEKKGGPQVSKHTFAMFQIIDSNVMCIATSAVETITCFSITTATLLLLAKTFWKELAKPSIAKKLSQTSLVEAMLSNITNLTILRLMACV